MLYKTSCHYDVKDILKNRRHTMILLTLSDQKYSLKQVFDCQQADSIMEKDYLYTVINTIKQAKEFCDLDKTIRPMSMY